MDVIDDIDDAALDAAWEKVYGVPKKQKRSPSSPTTNSNSNPLTHMTTAIDIIQPTINAKKGGGGNCGIGSGGFQPGNKCGGSGKGGSSGSGKSSGYSKTPSEKVGDYTATAKRSKFGGFVPHLKNKSGGTAYQSASQYKDPKHAMDEAKVYATWQQKNHTNPGKMAEMHARKNKHLMV